MNRIWSCCTPLLALVGVTLVGSQFGVAQEPETLIEGDVRHGGFGGPVVKFTEVNNEFGVLVGGRGGWIINDSFVLGAGGYGLVT
ncbi:MAG: hypothetical protein GTO63_32105, partial [Anaerolineae bacterium]|nr:hypothetical protein [Anaerolineae bacterium]NIQ83092.1 hypothetical protein [Anaerolineae bacterium]